MTLTIKENYKIMNSEITCYQLDNVCDEINYTESKSSFKDNQLQKKNNMEEYINYNSSTLLKNNAYSKVYIRLQKFIKEMKTNYMFMKGYEETYSITFNKRREKIINKCTEVLRSPKDENASAIYKIVRELIDSLLFNELYDYLFSNCLVNFYKDDEKNEKSFKRPTSPQQFKKSDKKLEQNVHYEEKRSNLNRRNFSPDNNVSTNNRIVQYLDDPKESDALAEIKKISQKAKKQYSKNWDNIDNTTKNNRVAFKDVDNENRPVKTSNAPFERRKKNFSTQKYIVKNKKKNLIDELNERKQEKDNNKKDNENNQSKRENEITQRIIQYFEDPKDSSALAQVKKISQKAKNQK